MGDEAPTQREDRGTAASAVDLALRHARRVIALVIGGTFVAIGVVLVFVPGPGLLGIAIGLAVLASEFEWARRWLRRIRRALPERVRSDGRDRRD